MYSLNVPKSDNFSLGGVIALLFSSNSTYSLEWVFILFVPSTHEGQNKSTNNSLHDHFCEEHNFKSFVKLNFEHFRTRNVTFPIKISLSTLYHWNNIICIQIMSFWTINQWLICPNLTFLCWPCYRVFISLSKLSLGYFCKKLKLVWVYRFGMASRRSLTWPSRHCLLSQKGG